MCIKHIHRHRKTQCGMKSAGPEELFNQHSSHPPPHAHSHASKSCLTHLHHGVYINLWPTQLSHFCSIFVACTFSYASKTFHSKEGIKAVVTDTEAIGNRVLSVLATLRQSLKKSMQTFLLCSMASPCCLTVSTRYFSKGMKK